MAFMRRFDHEGGQRALLAWVEPHLAPGEQVLGVVPARRLGWVRQRWFIVGVTARRLVLVGLDAAWQPIDGAVTTILREQLSAPLVWGWGHRPRFGAGRASEEIRFRTPAGRYRFAVLGASWIESVCASGAHLEGLDALVEFLLGAASPASSARLCETGP
jgi:hypothetical protein